MTKVKGILLVALCTVVVAVSAQDLKIGLKAGLNLNSLSKVDASFSGLSLTVFNPDGMGIGYHAGVFSNISFSNLLGFQPEILYSAQGGKIKTSDNLGPVETGSVNYSYINIPLLLEIKPVQNLGILVGPQIGLQVGKSMKAGNEKVSGADLDNYFKDAGIDKPFNTFDFSVAVGAQYCIMNSLYIGARYNYGITNSLDKTIDGASVKGWKNGVIQISVGYAFNL
ncbi:MAG: PorT family protein [Paludibacter sp.]|nr:PorT family protein [Paludibacter sp.]